MVWTCEKDRGGWGVSGEVGEVRGGGRWPEGRPRKKFSE